MFLSIKQKLHAKNQLVLSTCIKHQKMLPLFLAQSLQLFVKWTSAYDFWF